MLGLVIEAITREPYRVWIEREIVEAAGLRETTADMPLAKGVRVCARSYLRLPLGRRLVIPGDNPTNAMAAGRRVRQHGRRRRPLSSRNWRRMRSAACFRPPAAGR